MVMVSVALVMAVIVTNVYSRKNSHHQVPKWAKKMLLRCYAPAFRRGRRVRHKKTRCNGTDLQLETLSMPSEEDSFTSHGCHNCHRNEPHFARGDHHSGTFEVSEWQLLSKVLDRAFFWIFLLSSVVAMLAVFSPLIFNETDT